MKSVSMPLTITEFSEILKSGTKEVKYMYIIGSVSQK